MMAIVLLYSFYINFKGDVFFNVFQNVIFCKIKPDLNFEIYITKIKFHCSIVFKNVKLKNK